MAVGTHACKDKIFLDKKSYLCNAMKTNDKDSIVNLFVPDTQTHLNIPFAENGIAAGFPSPADDYMDVSLDLNKRLIKNPSSTFFAKVKGTSMIDEGIDNGDLLIIDKSIDPTNNCIAVSYIDGEFTIKKVVVEDNHLWLMPANKEFKPIKVTEDNDFIIWGVVRYVIKKKF